MKRLILMVVLTTVMAAVAIGSAWAQVGGPQRLPNEACAHEKERSPAVEFKEKGDCELSVTPPGK